MVSPYLSLLCEGSAAAGIGRHPGVHRDARWAQRLLASCEAKKFVPSTSSGAPRHCLLLIFFLKVDQGTNEGTQLEMLRN